MRETTPAGTRLDADTLHARLDARNWRRVAVVECCDSTQTIVRRLADEAGDRGWWLALADQQTAGRGRAGAAWFSPAGTALHLSLGCRIALPLAVLPRASLVVGLAVARVLAAALQIAIGLKWPNDLMLRDSTQHWRKVAGILCEADATAPRASATGAGGASAETAWFAGIGLNVSTPIAAFPAALRSHVASLCEATAAPIDRTELAARLANAVRDAVGAWQDGGGALPCEAIDEMLCFRNELVDLDDGRETAETVVLRGVDASGWLRVQTPSGAELGPERVARPLAIVAAHGDPAWRAPAALAVQPAPT